MGNYDEGMDVNPYENPRATGYWRLPTRPPDRLFDWRKILVVISVMLSAQILLSLAGGIALAWADQIGWLPPAVKEWLR